MKLKHGASVEGMHPAIWPALMDLDSKMRGTEIPIELTITSGTDGKHSQTSRHYLGTAVDVRTWANSDGTAGQMKGEKRKHFFNFVRNVLGDDWFVLDEGTHFHIDYRPRYKGE